MIELGKIQTLEIVKETEFGVYLGDGINREERILLPKKNVEKGSKIGDKIEVFVYRDSEDRLIATTKHPLITLGKTAVLKVTDTGKLGAFLDWGLEKDLFLPFKQQTVKAYPGEEYIVALYIDKSNRLCATMNVYDYLNTDSPYKKDDKVEGIIYNINDSYGAFVAVDNKYNGMIYKTELTPELNVGDRLTLRVVKVREDGKLELSTRQRAYLQIDADAEKILKVIDEYDGILPFTEKASPEAVKRVFGMSKAAFKRAIGRLLKEDRIIVREKSIVRKQEDQ